MFRVLVDPIYAIVNQNSLKTPDLHSSWCADHFAPVFNLWGLLWAEIGDQTCLGLFFQNFSLNFVSLVVRNPGFGLLVAR